MKLPGKGVSWRDFFGVLWKEWKANKITDTAGAVAFSGVVAIFPFLLFLVSLASLLINPSGVDSLVAALRRVAPSQVADILEQRIVALTQGHSPALLGFGAALTIWSASGGVSALMRALNRVYDTEEGRPFWKTTGLALGITIGGAALMVAASALAVAAPVIAGHLGAPFATILLWARFPVAVALVMLGLALVYYLLPNVEQDFAFLTPGAVVAVVLWVAASLGFSLYVSKLGRYELVYGALGGVIIFLFWMWISSIAVLLGAEINATLEHLSGEGKGSPKTSSPGYAAGHVADARPELGTGSRRSPARSGELDGAQDAPRPGPPR